MHASVFEIKVFVCAPFWAHRNLDYAPERFPMQFSMYLHYNRLKKPAHNGRTMPKTECTLNFEHCTSSSKHAAMTLPMHSLIHRNDTSFMTSQSKVSDNYTNLHFQRPLAFKVFSMSDRFLVCLIVLFFTVRDNFLV